MARRRRTCRKQRGGVDPQAINIPTAENIGINTISITNHVPNISQQQVRRNQYVTNMIGKVHAPGVRQTAVSHEVTGPSHTIASHLNMSKATFNKNRHANTVKVTSGGLLRSANTTRRLPTNRPSLMRTKNTTRQLAL